MVGFVQCCRSQSSSSCAGCVFLIGVCAGGAWAANSSWNAHLDASSSSLFRIFIESLLGFVRCQGSTLLVDNQFSILAQIYVDYEPVVGASRALGAVAGRRSQLACRLDPVSRRCIFVVEDGAEDCRRFGVRPSKCARVLSYFRYVATSPH